MAQDILDEMIERGDIETRYEGRERVVNAKVRLLRAFAIMPTEALLETERQIAGILFVDKDVQAVLRRAPDAACCDDTGFCCKHGKMALGDGYCPECGSNLI